MFIRDSVWDAMVFRALMHPSPYCCTYFNADSDNGQLLIHVMMPKAFLSFTFINHVDMAGGTVSENVVKFS